MLAGHVTEAAFMATVEEMAQWLGWWVWHDNDSRRNAAGLPDLLLVHPDHGFLWLELKTTKGVVRKEQRAVIDLFQRAGGRTFVVRPTDMDLIEALLRGEEAI